MMTAPVAMAQTVVDGNGGSGYTVTTDSALSSTNSRIVGPSYTAGNSSTQTLYTGFSTTGGAGSGGGGGLGGVFFVDNAASLSLNNVSLTNNTVTGGQGGGVKVDSVGQIAFSLAGSSADASALAQFNPTVSLAYNSGAVQVTSFTLAQSTTLFSAGSGVGVAVSGQVTPVGATVSSTTLNNDGSETVNLAAPLTLTPGHGLNQVDFVLGNIVGLTNSSSSGVQQGMQVVVPGSGTYTVNTVSYDGSGNVTSFTLKDSNGNAVPLPLFGSVYVVNAQHYDFTRLADSVAGSSVSNTLISTGPVAGFAVGMTVTGTGVPSGTVVTAVSTQTDQSTGDVTTTVTLNNSVNLATATDLKATANPLVSNTGAAVLNLPSVTGLAVGETITGVGIPTGTKIVSISGNTVTLNNTLGQGAINAINNGTLLVSVDPVVATGAGTVTLASVVGLTVGAEITGQSSIPANAQITHIDTATNTVSYTINPALANANTGGAMNSLNAPGVAGFNGGNGQTGTSYGAIFDDGEGAPGTNGQTAGNGSNAAGGNGGSGGSGSNGSSTNKSLIVGTTFDTSTLIADFFRTDGDAAGLFTTPSVPGDIAHAVIDAAAMVFDITQLVAWQIAEKQGLVALGGGGGQGGNGGNGSDFFGGGAGGNGGQGGRGAESYTLGGTGGTGGNGGNGGFGAGGGDSGAGGAGGATGNQANGGSGGAGSAGFGGGAGSTAGQSGTGGSGFGGAIFVRSGGSLTISGNSVFQNNLALAGSSSNGGSVGQSAGADLFMMTGSTVNLQPGTGNTITFYDSIADDSAASIGTTSIAAGSGASIHILGGGTVQFYGTNTYSGATEISGATLEAQDGVGINPLSQILFDGTGSIGHSLSPSTAGVLLSSGDFTRSTGSLPNNVKWTGSGGFAATSSGLSLDFGAINGGAKQTLTWNQGGFTPTGSTLIFGSDAADATGIVTLNNAINLNAQAGQIAVYHNAGNTAAYDAVLAGKVTNGTLTVGDTGYTGTLLMTAQNSLSGLTLNAGTVSTILNGQSGRLMDPSAGGFVTVNGGSLVLGGVEKLTAVNVALGGSITAMGAITAGNINNAGVIGFGSTLNAASLTNSGIVMLGGTTNVTNAITNQLGGTLYQNAATSAASASNAGTWNLAADLTTTGAVSNTGAINVIGVVSGSPAVETAATRTINATGFSGNGTVNLGGLAGATANTLVINQSGASTFSGVFSGAGGLTKTGVGVLTLTGANTFTGPLAINGGTLDTTGGGTFADSLNVTVGSSGTYIVGTDDTINSVTNNGVTTVNAVLNLATFANTATGTATVNGSLISTGDVTNANSMTFATGSTETISGNLSNTATLNSTGTLGVTGLFTNDTAATATLGAGGLGSNTFGSLTNNGSLTASASLIVTNLVTNSSTGTMTLNLGSTPQFGSLTNSGAITANDLLTVSGAYTQNAGSLTANAGLTTGTLSGLGGAINLNNNSVFSLNQTSNGTFAGTINGNGSLSIHGGATLTLTGTNTYTGATTIAPLTTLALSGTGSIATSSGVADNGTFDISGTSAGASIKTLSGNGLASLGAQLLTITAGSTTFSGVLADNGIVSGLGGGLTISGGTETLTGTNTYTGATTTNLGATLALSGTGSIATSSGVADNGTFDISQNTTGASIKTLSGSGVTSLGSKILTLTNGSTTFAGVIQDGGIGGGTLGNVIVSGGTETLTGTNTYTGATTVNSGATLALKTGGSIATSSSVTDNGTFDISQTTTGASIMTLLGNGVVSLGSKILNIINGSTTFAGVIQDGGIGGGTQGNLTVAGGTETLTGTNTYTGATTTNLGATLALSGTGSIAASSGVADNGTFDISQNTTGASIKTLSGSGVTSLGSKTLTITNGSTTFAGVIQDGGIGGGTLGNVIVSGGTETLTGTNTYTGATTVNSGATLALQTGGAIATSSGVADNGTFDISQTTTGASIKTLSGNGVTSLGSKTLTITNGSTTFAGVIQDGGIGGGTLGNWTVSGGAETLTGTNTYTGATSVGSGATLALKTGGSIAASSGVADNGTFDISQTTSGASIKTLSGNGVASLGSKGLTITNGSTTFAGVIQDGGIGGGTGSTVTVSSGTQTLSGVNTFTGGATINSGATLALSGAGAFASSSGLTDNGTFDISQTTSGSSITTLGGAGAIVLGNKVLTITAGAAGSAGTAPAGVFSGAISGNGGLAITGGHQELHGVSTYSGGTTVTNATLSINSGAALGAATGGLTLNNATLVADGNVTTNRPVTLTGTDTIDTGVSVVSLGGNIGGTGALKVAGAGTLSLSGVNTDSGGITVGPNATLATTSSAALGTGPLAYLSPTNTVIQVFTGSAQVVGPLNLVNGSTTNLYIQSSDSLMGVGTINANVIIQSGGSSAPGDGAGTLTITGSLANMAGSTYFVDVDGPASSIGCSNPLGCAGEYSSLVLTGSGSVYTAGGVIAPLLRGIGAPANNNYTPALGTTYLVVQASGGVTGSYSSLTQPTSGLAAGTRFDTLYLPNVIELVATPASFKTVPGMAALNGNQNQVAGALDALRGAAGPRNNVSATQDLGIMYGIAPQNLPQAYSTLSGEVSTGAKSGAFKMSTEFLSLISDAGVDDRASNDVVGPKVWGSAFGVGGRTRGNALLGSTTLSSQAQGVAFGAEYRFSPSLVAGVAGAGGGANWSLEQALGKGNSSGYMLAAYASWQMGQGYVSGSGNFGTHDVKTDRYALALEHITAKYSGQVYGGRIETGYAFPLNGVTITPYAAVQTQAYKTPTYSETDGAGGVFGLTYNGQTSSDTRTELGARFDVAAAIGSDSPLLLSLRTGWAHDRIANPTMQATFNAALQPGAMTGANAVFPALGATASQDAALIALSAKMNMSNRMSFNVNFDGGEFSNGASNYGVSGTMRFRW